MPFSTILPSAEVMTKQKFSCPTCGGEMIQKSRARLIVVGLCMIASVALAFAIPLFSAPGIILALTGIYLLAWATLGERARPGRSRRAPSSAPERSLQQDATRTTVRREGAPNYSRGGCAPQLC